MDVVHAGPHLGEAGRVAAPLLGRPRHHGVQPADALRPALIHPLVDALVVGDDDRRLLLVLGRHVVEEHVGRLDDVVVDAHQDQVVGLHIQVVPSRGVTVSALSDRDLARTANRGPGDESATERHRVIELRRGGQALGGSYLYEGEGLITGWHSHEVHQIEYAIGGVVEVETASAHYLLPPQQAAWIPAGLEHQATMTPDVRTVAVMFDAQMIPSGGRPRANPGGVTADSGDDDLRAAVADRPSARGRHLRRVLPHPCRSRHRGAGSRSAAEPSDLRASDRRRGDGLHEGTPAIGDRRTR